MKPSEFLIQPRGPRHFDTWRWDQLVDTELGQLPLELYCEIGAQPTEAMVGRAGELAAFARSQSAVLLDLIHGHYRYAEVNNWLEHWNVPGGLDRREVLGQVESIILNVYEDLFASVHVNPLWDPEHKLNLAYDGAITEVNDSPFQLDAGVLIPQ